MKKVVAVDGRFERLIKELEMKGYEVVDLYQQGKAVDACVYHDGIRDYHSAVGSFAGGGVLLINGKGKTADDIDFIITRGTYSSLF